MSKFALNRRYLQIAVAIGLVMITIVVWPILSQPGAVKIISIWIAALEQQPIIYALVLFLVTAAMLPAILIIMMGGYLYGAITGSIISSFAYLLGATVSFYIGRLFGRRTIDSIAKRHPGIHALNLAIEHKGLLIVLLSRLAVVIPYNILNVISGASRVPLGQYIFGTWLGSLPVIIGNSILGESAPGLLDIVQGKVKLDVNGYLMIALGLGIIFLLVLVVRWSANQLQQEIEAQNKEA